MGKTGTQYSYLSRMLLYGIQYTVRIGTFCSKTSAVYPNYGYGHQKTIKRHLSTLESNYENVLKQYLYNFVFFYCLKIYKYRYIHVYTSIYSHFYTSILFYYIFIKN